MRYLSFVRLFTNNSVTGYWNFNIWYKLTPMINDLDKYNCFSLIPNYEREDFYGNWILIWNFLLLGQAYEYGIYNWINIVNSIKKKCNRISYIKVFIERND